MKRCPACERTYADDQTTFCLADGSLLSPPYDPEATQRIYDLDATQRIPARLTNPPPTEILTTNPPSMQPPPYYMTPAYPVRRKSRATLYLVTALLALLIGVGIFMLVRFSQKSPSSDS